MNEADVRQKVESLLKRLGYRQDDIEREKSILVPIGKDKKNIFPDFIISANGKKRFVIETKSPKTSISNQKTIDQSESYALLLKLNKFVICNGQFLSIYKITGSKSKKILTCKVGEFKKIEDNLSKRFFLKPNQKNNLSLLDLILTKDTNDLKEKIKKTIKKRTAKEINKIIDNFFQ